MSRKPTRTNLSVLAQLCNLIPAFLVSKIARQSGVDKKARTFSPWSHLVALLFAQFTHALSLNDVCDALKNHAGKLLRIRDASPPSKNALSHANRQRDGDMAQTLFWEILNHLTTMCPRFGGQTFKGMPRRFKRAVYAVDSSTIRLVVNCIDWARHRRRKAAAKLHLASSIAELYKSRWEIEVFFKEIKQTLQLCDFLGHNKNAVLWQVWTALILYVLLRFLAFANSWQHGFKRFFCLLRSSVWDGVLIASLASLCGTARGAPAMRAAPEQLYLPGFGPREARG